MMIINSYRFAAAPAFDPAALDYFTRAEALGGSFDLTATNALYTETYTKAGTDALVRYLKGAGNGVLGTVPVGITASDLWTSKLTELYPLGAVTFGGVLAKLKHAGTAALTNVGPFVTGDYLPVGVGAGLKGKTSSYLATGLSVLSMDKSSFCMGAYATDMGVFRVGGSGLIGTSYTATGDTDRLYIGQGANTTTENFQFGVGNKFPIFTNTTAGLFMGQTGSTNIYKTFKNGSPDLSTTDWNNNGFQTGTFRLLSGYQANGGGYFRVTAAHIGTGLTDAEAAYLSWCLNAWATYFGFNTYANPV